jgi:NAD/NADP transhydrogenase beta subunit
VILGTIFLQSSNFIDACYIVAFSFFIYGMSGLTGPRTPLACPNLPMRRRERNG